MITLLRAPAALLFGVTLLGGCADMNLMGDNGIATSSIGSNSRIDPICTSLAAQIDALRREGVADKIEKAAAKKYKMTAADLTKADLLTKANSEFQVKCSTLPPKSAAVQAYPAQAAVAAPAKAVPASTRPAAAVAPTGPQTQ